MWPNSRSNCSCSVTVGVSVGSIGIRAGLFAEIDNRGSVSASELAAELGFDEHLVRVWCRAAFAFEFLDADSQGRYRLTPGTATVLLDESHPLYMGGRFLFATATWQDTLVYPTRSPTTRPPPRQPDPQPPQRASEELDSAQLGATVWVSGVREGSWIRAIGRIRLPALSPSRDDAGGVAVIRPGDGGRLNAGRSAQRNGRQSGSRQVS
jgi:hypothetical protein